MRRLTSNFHKLSTEELFDLWIEFHSKKPERAFFEIHKELFKRFKTLYLGGIDTAIAEIESFQKKMSEKEWLKILQIIEHLQDIRKQEQEKMCSEI